MIRLCLIGPGDIDFHFQEILGISKRKLDSELEKIVSVINPSNFELVLVPDKGISFEIAKKFKEKGGRVIGLVPKSDRSPGIGHLKEYIETRVNGHKLFDEIIDTGDWAKHNLTISLFGDAILYLGKSPGVEGERNYAIYMYKIVYGFKKEVDQAIEIVHKEARAGKELPYTVLTYTSFLKDGRFSFEDEAYAKKFRIDFVYVENSGELGRRLREFNKK